MTALFGFAIRRQGRGHLQNLLKPVFTTMRIQDGQPKAFLLLNHGWATG
jgi:hypothetical protein